MSTQTAQLDSVDQLYERARALESKAHFEEAQHAYLAVLQRDATHFGALNDLGTLLYRTGHHKAALITLSEAVRLHPENAIGLANLAAMLLDDNKIEMAGAHYEAAIRIDPQNAQAHQSLAVMHLRRGDAQAARSHGKIGFGKSAVTIWPFRGEGPAVPILVLHSALGGNLHTDRFLDDRVFHKATIVAEFHDPVAALPHRTLIFNGIGDADRCHSALIAAQTLLPPDTPVINAPALVLQTDRVTTSTRLGALPGVVTAAAAMLPREKLLGPRAPLILEERGFSFPLVMRSPGYHTGEHFIKVEKPAHLHEAAESLPGERLLVMDFLDTRGRDGNVRKYRAMIVDGQLYPLHLAIAQEWKVHYFRADMEDRQAYRDEEAAFLRDMPGVVGSTGMRSLQRIAQTLGLEYAGIDFTLGRDGEIIVFEANATMVVLPPDDAPKWDYRRAAVHAIDDAVRSLLLTRAG